MNGKIKEEVKNFPQTPGVYLMYNNMDEVIYVGKAVNLRRRVLQYFTESGKRSNKIAQMIASIDHISWLPCDTELVALILESNLIKRYRPRYNSALRKDENHPYLRVDRTDPFPAVRSDIGTDRETIFSYMGPYYKSMKMEETVLAVSHLFGLRTCKKDFRNGKVDRHPCLNYHLGYCCGVCMGAVSAANYAERLQGAVDFLRGIHQEETLLTLKTNMEKASECLDFECAVRLRNQLAEMQGAADRLNFSRSDQREEIHLWSFAGGQDGEAFFTALLYLIHGNHLSGRDCFRVQRRPELSTEENYAEYLREFYRNAPSVPENILLSSDILDIAALVPDLSEREEICVSISVPRDEEKERLAKLAAESAELMHSDFLKGAVIRRTGMIDPVSESI